MKRAMQRGKRSDAEPMLAAAREAFAELGASPWIKRTDAAAADESTTTEQTALPA
jgi:hypothetical protein